MNLTAPQRREIREREQKATKGPWEVLGAKIFPTHKNNYVASCTPGNHHSIIMVENNASFIAHSRTDVPTLLNDLDEAMEAVRNYGRHQGVCGGLLLGRERECECGLQALLDAYDKEPTQ